ncbi:S8 family peptidase [Amycolatopsis sp. cmx-11-12]|uniref:S8 family peptidase n=1 Tax=Amycolatopsis sp. cmx-11-12 TaxID=2785795 RepID=UPI0039184771
MRRAKGLAVAGTLAAGLGLAAIPSADAAPSLPIDTTGGAHFAVLVPKGTPFDLAEMAIGAHEGSIVQRWPQIGVIIARSKRADFATNVRKESGVVGVGATRNKAELARRSQGSAPISPKIEEHAARGQRTPAAAEPLAANQWNMKLIGADQANEINQGSRDVLVGILDSGIDSSHPDLKNNIDKSTSVNCANAGVPDQTESAWQDDVGHGTHVAGIVAAAKNGIGVAGVAPNVRLASIKVGGKEGFIYPESAICGYIWAADHGVDIANTSLAIDPWYLWCKADPDQAAVTEAVRRSVTYAATHSVTPVSSLGNNNWDLAHDIVDSKSPTNGPTVTRNTDSSCLTLPAELPGVIGVSSVGSAKSRYYNSNHGTGLADLTAPGGDKKFQIPATPDANGQVLSTLPGGQYGYLQGTSMAAPHVTGVLALLKSRNPGLAGATLKAAADGGAEVLPCPTGGVHDPGGTGEFRAVCEGGSTGAGFYGKGLVNALKAVR